MRNQTKGFTLLEIILVIAAIGILAAIVLVAINPNRQLAQVRNAERRSEINTIYKAIEQYLIDTGSYPAGITTSIQDICINGNTTNCVNLGVLVPDYIAAIPIDPGGAAYKVGINAGNNRVSVIAINAELGQGILMNGYSNANGGNDIVYGNGVWVAVVGSQIMRSIDGFNWTVIPAPAAVNWRAVIYDGPVGNKQFVAVSSSGGSLQPVMTSSDGITWTLRNVPQTGEWRGIAYGNGVYVAISSTGTRKVMTSTNAIDWTLQDAGATNNSAVWWSITHGGPTGGQLFVAVSVQGQRLMTSPDGITWTPQAVPSSNRWFHVDWDNSQFVALGNTGTANRVMTSPDGITWTLRITPNLTSNVVTKSLVSNVATVTTSTPHGMSVGNMLVNVAGVDATFNVGSISRPGVTITAVTSNTLSYIRTAANVDPTDVSPVGTVSSDPQWTNLAYGSGVWVATARDGFTRIMTSSDNGVSWVARSHPGNDQSWEGVEYANGLFVAVAVNGIDRVITSPDGITWTSRTTNPKP